MSFSSSKKKKLITNWPIVCLSSGGIMVLKLSVFQKDLINSVNPPNLS